MKRTITTIAALAISTAFVTAADAAKKPDGAAKPKADPAAMFAKLDANSDGSVSKEEFTGKAKDKAKSETAFGKKDKDGDGKLTKEEFMATGKKAK